MNTTTRPTNPADISFDRRCFVQDGTKVEWVVGGMLAPNYPKRFDTEEAAERYAKKIRGYVTRDESPRMVRIAWTLAELG